MNTNCGQPNENASKIYSQNDYKTLNWTKSAKNRPYNHHIHRSRGRGHKNHHSYDGGYDTSRDNFRGLMLEIDVDILH